MESRPSVMSRSTLALFICFWWWPRIFIPWKACHYYNSGDRGKILAWVWGFAGESSPVSEIVTVFSERALARFSDVSYIQFGYKKHKMISREMAILIPAKNTEFHNLRTDFCSRVNLGNFSRIYKCFAPSGRSWFVALLIPERANTRNLWNPVSSL